jgi:two-component system phosphate regulon sensor histidine kinase PhoR
MTRLHRLTGSLLARLILGYALIAIVFAGAWLWSLYGPVTEAALSQQQRNLTAVAQAAALVAAQSPVSPQEIARQLVARTDLRLTIVASDGTVLADSNFDPAGMENHLDRPEIASALDGHRGVARRISRTEDREELYVAVPASAGGNRVALRVSQPLAEIERIASRSRQLGLALLAGSLVLALGIAVVATRQTTRPIAALSEAAERMAGGNLSIDVPVVPTDLEQLANALASLRSQMAARLKALEDERLTLRTTLDGLTDAVLLLDGGTIRLANAAADRMLRRPPGGWPDTPLVSAGLPGGIVSAIESHGSSSGPSSVDLDADPTGRVLRLLIAPLGGRGTSGRVIVSISDVTEISRLDAVRRDFVANASHELKTPAAGIRLLAQSAEIAASDGDIEQSLAFSSQIELEAERLQRLVGDLLDLSRLQTTPAADAITDVRQAVDNAVLSHRSAASRKGLEVSTDFSAVQDRDVYVAADGTDLAIALDNLLDNAITYTAAGAVSVVVQAEGEDVAITVSDTGPGIALEHHPRIFERFYRIDKGRARGAGGTGLGLALVRHVAERSGGSVVLDSTPGEGSRFTVTLPRAR